MPRVSELEGAQAGFGARIVHSLYRRALGRGINPAKVAPATDFCEIPLPTK